VYVADRGSVKRFKITYRDSEGKRRFKWLPADVTRLADAVRAREDLSVSIRRREIIVDSKGMTFGQVREQWVAARKLRPRTAGGYDFNLKAYASGWENVDIRTIERPQLLTWLGQLRSIRCPDRPLKEGTRALILAAASAVFEYAVLSGHLKTNPCRQIPKSHRPRQGEGRKRFLDYDEEARLLAVCEPWLRPIVAVALTQALRLGEVAGLQWEDVDFENSKLRVHQQLDKFGELQPTKTAKADRRDRRDANPIDLLPSAYAALQELRAPSGRVFSHAPAEIGRAFTRAVRKAKLPTTEAGKPTFHSLRHTAITRLANSPDLPLVYVRDFAGHQSLQVTEGYIHRIESARATDAAAAAMGGAAVAPALRVVSGG